MSKYQIGIMGIVLLVVMYLQFGLDQKTAFILVVGILAITMTGTKKE